MQKMIEVIINDEVRPVLVEYKRIRRLYLRIKENGMLYVTCPRTTTLTFIRTFLKEKEDWIIRTEKKVETREEKRQTGVDGERITWLGQELHVRVEAGKVNRMVVDEENKEAVFYLKEDTREIREKVFYRTAGKRLAELIAERRGQWDHMICEENCKPLPKITLKYMTSRWGSCTPAKSKISISVRLIHYPTVCLDYILLHEYAHILEGNHSSKFYAVVEKFMPQWKEYNQLLR